MTLWIVIGLIWIGLALLLAWAWYRLKQVERRRYPRWTWERDYE